jgi:hypothetical protein
MWGYRDPAMKQLTSVDPRAQSDDFEVQMNSFCNEIADVLEPSIIEKPKPKTAFVVTGGPGKALVHAHDVIVNQRPIKSEFATDDQPTLVFWSDSGFHMSLKPVKLRLNQDPENINEIEVDYYVMMRGTMDEENYFAMIPLGQLPAGEYRVIVKQVRGTSAGWPESGITKTGVRVGPVPLVPKALVSPGCVFIVRQR